MKKMFARLKTRRGVSMTEYLIMLAVVAIAAIALFSLFGKQIQNVTSDMISALSGNSGTLSQGANKGTPTDYNVGNASKDAATGK